MPRLLCNTALTTMFTSLMTDTQSKNKHGDFKLICVWGLGDQRRLQQVRDLIKKKKKTNFWALLPFVKIMKSFILMENTKEIE